MLDVDLAAGPRGDLSVYPVTWAEPWGVDAFVTDRFGGVSEGPYTELNLALHVGDDEARVLENRRRVALAVGVPAERLVIAHQVHGRDAVRVTDPFVGDADALVTTSSDLALAVLVADCVPVLLADAASPLVGVAHAGWRGLASGVLASAVQQFPDAVNLRAFVGPAVSQDGYQIGPEVAQAFTHIPGAVVPDVGDRSRLDLKRVAVAQLVALGLTEENIVTCRQWTDGGETFFSDRSARPCGRFGLIARRRS